MRFPKFRHRRSQRAKSRVGFSLLELVIASASTTILIAGLGTSVFITSRAFDDADGEIARNLDASYASDEVMTDLQLAMKFTERTSTSVEFKVPDRDGDGAAETIRYAWSGNTGDPLTKQFNSSSSEPILDDVHGLSFNYATRTEAGVPEPVIPEVVFQGFADRKEASNTTSIDVPVPSGVSPGELLIAVIAVRQDVKSDFQVVVPNWTFIGAESNSDKITLGVWWRIASASEPSTYTFSWGANEEAYGWMMRFSGHDAMLPIGATSFNDGKSAWASTPSSSVDREYSTVLILSGSHKDEITQYDAEVDDYATITSDFASVEVSGRAAYKSRHYLGSVSSQNFPMNKTEEYVTATVVLEPAS